MATRFWTIIRTGLNLLLILSISILFSSCSVKSPKAPTWDTNLTVPLIARHYSMTELIDRLNEDALSYDSVGNISLSFEQKIDTIAIDAGLSASNISEQFNHRLGEVTIASPEPMNLELSLTDYVSIEAGEISDVGFTASKDFDEIAQFQSATIADGKLILAITNHFDLAIDSLNIWIVDIPSSDTLAEYIFTGGLAVGESKTDTVDLAGKTTTSQLHLKSRIHTPGGTLFSVSDKYLGVQLGFSDEITVSSAAAQVPAQQKSYSSSIELTESHRLTTARISTGTINISIRNSSNLAANIDFQINEIRSSGDAPLTVQAQVLAGGTRLVSVNLAGYELNPDLSGSRMAVGINAQVDLPGSGSAVVQVNSADEFEVTAGLSNLEFSQISGIVAPTIIEMATVHEDVDLPKGMEQIRLTDAVVTLNLYSEANIPAEISIDLRGNAGQYLNIMADINGGSPQDPGLTQIILDDLGSLINPVPQSITISGSAVVGDGSTIGTVYSNSKVWGAVKINSPLKFALGATEIEGDINSTDIEQDDIDEISDRLLSGTIQAAITNHLPFGCQVQLYLSGDSATLYSNPELTFGPLSVDGGTLSAEGLVTQAVVSNAVIHLSDTDFDIVKHPTLYIGQSIILPGTGGQVVNVLNSDYLDINAYMELSTRLGGEWN